MENLKVKTTTLKAAQKTFFFFACLIGFSAYGQERQESLKSIEISFGANFPTSRAFEKKDAHYSLGLGYAWDVDVAFIEVRADHTDRFSGDPSQRYTSFTGGGNYIFIDQDLWALFGGLNVGLGITKLDGLDTKGGFHLGTDIGLLFLRNADVNLDFRIRLAYNTAEFRDSHPVLVGLIGGIHF